MHRRNCLQLGLAGLAGGSFVDLLAMRRASANEAHAPRRRQTNCILIWMDGGPTHLETFDLKPEAPVEIRGEFRPIETNVSGMRICEYMPKLAKIADKYSIIRSVQHNQGNHGAGNHYMMTGAPPRIPVGCGAFVSFHPSLGSVTAHERPAPHGLPSYFSLPSMTRSGGPNFLGAKYAPFVVANDPNNKDFRVRDVELPPELTEPHFQSRRDLRQLIDRLPRYSDPQVADPVAGYDENVAQGYNLVTTPEAQKAFDIHSEPDEVREAYGRNGFGQRALMARRLVEAGVPFVTIVDGGWDHHANLFDALRKRLPTWDQTVATLINDLDQRGLLETTMVIALGEFGRTPKISTLAGQSKAGRDHWANAMSILFAGGGSRGGQVIGATDRLGHSAVERVLSPENYVSTVYRKLGIDPDMTYHTPAGRPAHLVSDPTPIDELM
ncbi:MAG: DUF1501 domain-containing protein [Pirellulaceae bacterium]|jgi:hypothetical protein|nr:DUF1501 domain-containing protein [Pirellulaceae bacterium]